MPIRHTSISIQREKWFINDSPTYKDREFRGKPIEGLLLNSRMVNAMFDDENPHTKHLWNYPDTNEWNPDRNTAEFIKMLPIYKNHGLLAFTVNLQGGAPSGYYRLEPFRDYMSASGMEVTDEELWLGLPSPESQPWNSSGFTPGGSLKPAYLQRLQRILDKADELEMVVILGLFYFGQDERLANEASVKHAVNNACTWILENGYTNVLIEINNECTVPWYEHEILQPHRVHELIKLAKRVSASGSNLLSGTSYGGGKIPEDSVLSVSDFVLLHGNGVVNPERITDMVNETRSLPHFKPMPILFNEDDHFGFENESNNFSKAIESYVGWGYFDPGEGAGGASAFGDYKEGYQLVPTNWGINTDRKKSYFGFLRKVTSS